MKVGDVKLTEVYPQEALEAVAHLASGSFTIEPVAEGKILVVRSATSQVEVKAIRLTWMDEPAFSPDVSMHRGFLGEQNPEAVAEREKQIAMQLEQFELRIARKTDELLKSIDEIFEVHAKVSNQSLPLPKIMIQRSLGMIMLVGHPESVKIASEIIEATNSGPVRNRSGMSQPALFGGARSRGLPAQHRYVCSSNNCTPHYIHPVDKKHYHKLLHLPEPPFRFPSSSALLRSLACAS